MTVVNRPCDRRSPARWRWSQTAASIPREARLTVLPHEALLMNSLRRMLAEVPQLELKIGGWAGSGRGGGVEEEGGAPSSPAPGKPQYTSLSPPRNRHAFVHIQLNMRLSCRCTDAMSSMSDFPVDSPPK